MIREPSGGNRTKPRLRKYNAFGKVYEKEQSSSAVVFGMQALADEANQKDMGGTECGETVSETWER